MNWSIERFQNHLYVFHQHNGFDVFGHPNTKQCFICKEKIPPGVDVQAKLVIEWWNSNTNWQRLDNYVRHNGQCYRSDDHTMPKFIKDEIKNVR